jgi:hypothetical protein
LMALVPEWLFNQLMHVTVTKKVVGVFVRFSCAASARMLAKIANILSATSFENHNIKSQLAPFYWREQYHYR